MLLQIQVRAALFAAAGTTTFAISAVFAVSAGAAPPTPSVTHPLPTVPALGDIAALQARLQSRYERGQMSLPLSKALVTEGGSTLYSPNVNRVLCAATDERGKRTWLGTALGVKCVDEAGGVVRHYGVRDGLPEGRIAAIAVSPAGGVWCIVQGRPASTDPAPVTGLPPATPYHLCTFDPAAGVWKTLKTLPSPVPKPKPNSGGRETEADRYGREAARGFTGRPLLAVGADDVVFTIGISGAGETAAAYRWNRRAKVMEPLLWDAGQRADNPFLLATFVAIDSRDRSVWIGSNAGLLHRQPSPTGGNSTNSWERLLPDQSVVAGADAPGGGVWIAAQPRQTGDINSFPRTAAPPWKLHRIVGGKAVAEVREILVPAPPAQKPSEDDRRSNSLTPNIAPPVAVMVDDKGALWLTQKPSDYSRSYEKSSLAAWWQRAPGTGAWTRYEMQLERQRPLSRRPQPPDPPPLRRIGPSGEVKEFVSLAELAPAAVYPLTAFPLQAGSYGIPSAGYVVDGGSRDEASALYWAQYRFPTWICTDDLPPGVTQTNLPDMGGFSYPAMVSRIPARESGLEAVADPFDPFGNVWIKDAPGTSLLNLPADEIPDELRYGPRGRQLATRRSLVTSPDGPNVKRYALPPDGTVTGRPSVQFLTTPASGGGSVVLWTGGGLRARINPDGTVSSQILRQEQGYGSPITYPVSTADGAFLITSSGEKSEIRRYDPKTGAVPLEATVTVAGRIGGVTPNGGVVIIGTDGKVRILEKGAAEPVLFPVDFQGTAPAFGGGFGSGYSPGPVTVGATVWGFDARGELFGYDTERKRRTPAVELRSTTENGYPIRRLSLIPDSRGGVYTASESGVASVFHYDRERDQWEPVAPPFPVPPTRPGFNNNSTRPQLSLVAADNSEAWLLADGKNMTRYDRQRKAWDAPIPLPAPLQRGGYGSAPNEPVVVAAENGGAFYAGGSAGLWRYDRKAARWDEKLIPAPLKPSETPTGGPSSAGRILAVTPGKDTIYTLWNHSSIGNFAARLDRRTGAWTIDDETKGFPGRGMVSRLIATGAGAWLIHSDGTYFFDAAQNQWRRVFGQENAAAAVTDTDIVRIVDIAVDPATGDSLLLANISAKAPPAKRIGLGGFPQTPTYVSKSPALFRYSESGAFIARSPAPRGSSAPGSYVASTLLIDKGVAVIATNRGIFQTTGKNEETWKEVTPPAGFVAPTAPSRLQQGPGGRGLYIINSDSIAYWSSTESRQSDRQK